MQIVCLCCARARIQLRREHNIFAISHIFFIVVACSRNLHTCYQLNKSKSQINKSGLFFAFILSLCVCALLRWREFDSLARNWLKVSYGEVKANLEHSMCRWVETDSKKLQPTHMIAFQCRWIKSRQSITVSSAQRLHFCNECAQGFTFGLVTYASVIRMYWWVWIWVAKSVHSFKNSMWVSNTSARLWWSELTNQLLFLENRNPRGRYMHVKRMKKKHGTAVIWLIRIESC